MHFVLINGPKQSGKTTLAVAVANQLTAALPARQTAVLHLKKPIELALRAVVDSYYPELAGADYEDLKKTQIGGMQGRDFMIVFGEALHQRDPQFLPRMLFREANQIKDGREQIIIVDDLGRETEYAAFVHNADGTGIDVVYTESRGDRLYGHGERFDNDNRTCLRGYAGFIDPEIDELVNSVITKLGE